MSCIFPGCPRHEEKNGYCVCHQMYSNSVVVKVKEEVNKVSDKRKDTNALLKTMYPAFLATHKRCAIKADGCTKKATVVHHTDGRGIDEILNVATWVPCCPSCNLYVEEHHAEAEAKGLKNRQHQKASK